MYVCVRVAGGVCRRESLSGLAVESAARRVGTRAGLGNKAAAAQVTGPTAAAATAARSKVHVCVWLFWRLWLPDVGVTSVRRAWVRSTLDLVRWNALDSASPPSRLSSAACTTTSILPSFQLTSSLLSSVFTGLRETADPSHGSRPLLPLIKAQSRLLLAHRLLYPILTILAILAVGSLPQSSAVLTPKPMILMTSSASPRPEL